jgi:hypothetical protein
MRPPGSGPSCRPRFQRNELPAVHDVDRQNLVRRVAELVERHPPARPGEFGPLHRVDQPRPAGVVELDVQQPGRRRSSRRSRCPFPPPSPGPRSRRRGPRPPSRSSGPARHRRSCRRRRPRSSSCRPSAPGTARRTGPARGRWPLPGNRSGTDASDRWQPAHPSSARARCCPRRPSRSTARPRSAKPTARWRSCRCPRPQPPPGRRPASTPPAPRSAAGSGRPPAGRPGGIPARCSSGWPGRSPDRPSCASPDRAPTDRPTSARSCRWSACPCRSRTTNRRPHRSPCGSSRTPRSASHRPGRSRSRPGRVPDSS